MANEKYPITREDGSGNLRNIFANMFYQATPQSKVRIVDTPRTVCLAMSHPEFLLALQRGVSIETLLVQEKDESQRKYLDRVKAFQSNPESVQYALCLGLAHEFAGKDGVADYLLATVKQEGRDLTKDEATIMAEQAIGALGLAA